MQWIDGVLAKGEKVNFFHDEFRCPIYVKDLVTVVLALTSQWISGRTSSIYAIAILLDIMVYCILFSIFSGFRHIVQLIFNGTPLLMLQNTIQNVVLNNL